MKILLNYHKARKKLKKKTWKTTEQMFIHLKKFILYKYKTIFIRNIKLLHFTISKTKNEAWSVKKLEINEIKLYLKRKINTYNNYNAK